MWLDLVESGATSYQSPTSVPSNEARRPKSVIRLEPRVLGSIALAPYRFGVPGVEGRRRVPFQWAHQDPATVAIGRYVERFVSRSIPSRLYLIFIYYY